MVGAVTPDICTLWIESGHGKEGKEPERNHDDKLRHQEVAEDGKGPFKKTIADYPPIEVERGA